MPVARLWMFLLWTSSLGAQNCPEKAFVGLAHGLNNPPSIMDDIAKELEAQGYSPIFVGLSGHREDSTLSEMRHVSAKKWRTEFQDFMSQLNAQAERCNKPQFFVGYSMGALLHADFVSRTKEPSSSSKSVYLAPALQTFNFARFVTWIPLWNSVVLPSFNHETAIAQEGSSMAAFRALFEIQNDFNANASSELKQSPTLILMDPKDELVSFEKTQNLVARLELAPEWNIQKIGSSAEAKKNFKHHLFITRQSAGEEHFGKLMEKIRQFLRLQQP